VLPICNIRIIAEKPDYRPFPDSNDTSLGAELKRKRLELEWTQKDCAEYFKVLKDSYQKWEWNQIIPIIYRRKDINDFLGFNFWNNGTDDLANQILMYRIKQRLTQEQLAKLIDISPHTLNKIEKRKNLVTKNVKEKVSEFLTPSNLHIKS